MLDSIHSECATMIGRRPADTLDIRWYAVYTRSKHEKVVAEQLEQRQIACFLPLRKAVSCWKDRKRKVEIPLFPGYVFVNTCIREHRLDILKLSATVRIIESDDGPVSVPEDQIQSVRRLISSCLLYDPYPEVVQGDCVEVIRGPLQGLRGTLVRKKNTERFVLSVDLIQQSVMCEIDADDLRKVGRQQRN